MRSDSFELKHLCLLALFAAIAVAPMLMQGMPGGDDAGQHYEFAQQVVDSWQVCQVYPSFAGNANHGYGDVGLRVYPPLSYFALAAAYVVAGEWYLASIAVFFLIYLLGAMGVYLWAREFFDIDSSLASATIFTLAPFHLNEIYNNFLFAESAAGSILPFCFLFVTRAARKGDARDTILLALSYALLVCTHLPLTIIGSLALGAYAIALIGSTNISRYVALAISVALGLLLSSFYWVRMITEMNWIKHSRPEYFSKIWSYDENFLLTARTFTEFMSDEQALWLGDLMLIATLIAAVPAISLLRRTAEWSIAGRGLTTVLVAGIFFATPISFLLWKYFPLLQKVQFPWRWLNIVTLGVSMIAGAGLVAAARMLKGSQNSRLSLVVALSFLPIVFVSAFIVRAPHFTQRAEFEAKSGSFSAGETFEGWWPVWASKQAFSQRESVVADGRIVIVDEWHPTKRSFTIEAGAQTAVKTATFYYPHWKASVNGIDRVVEPSENGTIDLMIPSERSVVELRFVEPRAVKVTAWLSAFGFIAVVMAFAYIQFRRPITNGISS